MSCAASRWNPSSQAKASVWEYQISAAVMAASMDHRTDSGPGFFNHTGFFSHTGFFHNAGFAQIRSGAWAAGASVEKMGTSGRVSIVALSLYYAALKPNCYLSRRLGERT